MPYIAFQRKFLSMFDEETNVHTAAAERVLNAFKVLISQVEDVEHVALMHSCKEGGYKLKMPKG